MAFVIVLVAVVVLMAVGSWLLTRRARARFDVTTPDIYKSSAAGDLNVQTHSAFGAGPQG